MRAIALALGLLGPLVGCNRGTDARSLNWYVNPDNGGQTRLAARCSAASHGRYRIVVSDLPRDATSQREQLVRRLAARDPSIDLMNVDPPFVPEFAEAGFLAALSEADAARFTDGALKGAVDSATWRGKLVAAPLWANTQLLWYRKSVARRA
ncbi:MAG TPA: extracellular solute-binding protein, partial [Anaeromyxobacteraceae bacterium]|nr:extracellular solute-binding protein [Anaeromyxobacteraceae bacterium]